VPDRVAVQQSPAKGVAKPMLRTEGEAAKRSAVPAR
jgi:hypothetical protein